MDLWQKAAASLLPTLSILGGFPARSQAIPQLLGRSLLAFAGFHMWRADLPRFGAGWQMDSEWVRVRAGKAKNPVQSQKKNNKLGPFSAFS